MSDDGESRSSRQLRHELAALKEVARVRREQVAQGGDRMLLSEEQQEELKEAVCERLRMFSLRRQARVACFGRVLQLSTEAPPPPSSIALKVVMHRVARMAFDGVDISRLTEEQLQEQWDDVRENTGRRDWQPVILAQGLPVAAGRWREAMDVAEALDQVADGHEFCNIMERVDREGRRYLSQYSMDVTLTVDDLVEETRDESTVWRVLERGERRDDDDVNVDALVRQYQERADVEGVASQGWRALSLWSELPQSLSGECSYSQNLDQVRDEAHDTMGIHTDAIQDFISFIVSAAGCETHVHVDSLLSTQYIVGVEGVKVFFAWPPSRHNLHWQWGTRVFSEERYLSLHACLDNMEDVHVGVILPGTITVLPAAYAHSVITLSSSSIVTWAACTTETFDEHGARRSVETFSEYLQMDGIHVEGCLDICRNILKDVMRWEEHQGEFGERLVESLEGPIGVVRDFVNENLVEDSSSDE